MVNDSDVGGDSTDDDELGSVVTIEIIEVITMVVMVAATGITV